jgi:mono/diheme cytochrome c family protein
MDSSVVITIVVIAAVAWLAFLGVSALRSRGPEEVPSNLAPGESDDVMETKRLERTQQAAVLLSAFLAIGLPLYYLGETNRQEGFVDQFDQESVTRGEHLVEEFDCYSCHGPDGVGGVASYIEKRTGATVQWAAPPLNNIFYRYDRDAVRYWITYGRGNSPMPAWGLAGRRPDERGAGRGRHQLPRGEPGAAGGVRPTRRGRDRQRPRGSGGAPRRASTPPSSTAPDHRRPAPLAGAGTDRRRSARRARAILDGR